MNIFALAESVMKQLSAIPGLSFLGTYVTDFHARKTQIGQTIGDYKGYVRSVREAGGQVVDAARGVRKNEDDEAEEEDMQEDYPEYEDDDDETFGFN